MANTSAWKTVTKAPLLKTSPVLPPNTPPPVPELVLVQSVHQTGPLLRLWTFHFFHSLRSGYVTVNFFANEYLGITVSVCMLNMFSRTISPTEILMCNVTSLGSITKVANCEVRSSGLSLDPNRRGVRPMANSSAAVGVVLKAPIILMHAVLCNLESSFMHTFFLILDHHIRAG